MLKSAVDWAVFEVFRLAPGSRWGEAVNFFIYDSIKILGLLALMVGVIGYLRSFLPQQKLREWMSRRGVLAYFFAALFGAVTPFCSCSSIPIFLGFLKAGVPLGISFTFLVTSPLINEYLVVLMLGFFGWKITAAYVTSGMLVGMVAGVILGRLKLERLIEAEMLPLEADTSQGGSFSGQRERIRFGVTEAVSIVRRIWVWILFGVGLGAAIHNYVPEAALQSAVGRAGVFSVPIAVLIGTPMYGSCAAIVPIAVVLFQKGIPLGTALAFMMAVAALSLPEAVMLRRALKLGLIALFFGVTALTIILTGYLFNFLQPLLT